MNISILSHSFHGALAEGTVDVFTCLQACFDRLDAARSILTHAGYAGRLGVGPHTDKNEFAGVETRIGLVRRALSHRRTGRAGRHQGPPRLTRENERSHNR